MKISISMALSLFAAAYLSSCSGTKAKDADKEAAPQVTATEADLSKVDDSLPEATVMRVSLDANGDVVAGSESMRVVSSTSKTSTAEQDFANGVANAQAAKLDELDRVSSTQSWSLTSLFGFGGSNNPGQSSGYQGQDNQDNQDDSANQSSGYPTAPGQVGQNYPNQNSGQTQCGQCPQQSTTVCTPCGNQVEHRQGPSTSVYPTSRRTVYEHRTTDVHPTQYVDVYPVEHVRVHPTQTITNVHPLTRQVEYVGNHCQQVSACGYGAQFYPTISYNSYNQYYHFQSHHDHGGYRYFRYCRPRIFARYGW